MEASTAYDKIIGAIKAAEEAANQAGKAADLALSVSGQMMVNLLQPEFHFNYPSDPKI